MNLACFSLEPLGEKLAVWELEGPRGGMCLLWRRKLSGIRSSVGSGWPSICGITWGSSPKAMDDCNSWCNRASHGQERLTEERYQCPCCAIVTCQGTINTMMWVSLESSSCPGRERLRQIHCQAYPQLGLCSEDGDESQRVSGTRDAGECIMKSGKPTVRTWWEERLALWECRQADFRKSTDEKTMRSGHFSQWNES